MYGANSTMPAAGGAGVLAYTGFQSAWWLFAGLTMVFAGIAVIQLVKRPARHRP